jgi:fructose-1,6-bisphosphatase I
MAFIIEQAGGKASNGSQRILTLNVDTLHQRSPIYIGSTTMVETAERFMQKQHDYERTGQN